MAKGTPHRYLPALLMSAMAAIPIVTAGEILAHIGKSSSLAPIPSSGNGSTKTTPNPTAQPTAAPKATPQATKPSPTPTSAPKPTATAKPTPTATSKPSGRSSINGTFQGGSYTDMFGYLTASITVRSGRIVRVSISAPMDNPRSASINSQVVPILRSETLKAQSSNINGISGATATSEAYYYSLTDALKKAGL